MCVPETVTDAGESNREHAGCGPSPAELIAGYRLTFPHPPIWLIIKAQNRATEHLFLSPEV